MKVLRVAVVFALLLTASYVKEGAMDGGNPQVGGTGVEDDSKCLRWRSNGDFTVVLGL